MWRVLILRYVWLLELCLCVTSVVNVVEFFWIVFCGSGSEGFVRLVRGVLYSFTKLLLN
jgi:hypothetical protein